MLHVDGAEFYSNSEYLCWSIGSALSSEHVLDSKLPVCILPHSAMVDEGVKLGVHKTVAAVLRWSLFHCRTGIAPANDHDGLPLSGERAQMSGQVLGGGWTGCFWGFRFDEKARKEVNYFQRTYNHSLICMRCMAQKEHKNWFPELSYKNFHSTAGYRLTPISLPLSQLMETFCQWLISL